MARDFDLNNLIALPQANANQLQVLGQQLEAAARDGQGNPLVLPEAVQVALDDVVVERAALQEVLAPEPDSPEVRALDKLEDNAVAALILILVAWSRVKGQLPEGELAAGLAAQLGAEQGLAFINIKPRDEFGVVDTKLKAIDAKQLEPQLAQLGLGPLLAHLRDVHGRYGAALGITQAQPAEEQGKVRARYEALREAIKHYVGAVIGSVQRKKPETKALADTLLRPLVSWRSDQPRQSPKGEGEGEPPVEGGPTAPPAS